MPGTVGCLLAAKRYRDADHRLFHRDAGYQEGRRVRRSRDTRAMARGTAYGREVTAGRWAAAEFDALCRLWSAGVAVPYPVQLLGTELLLEFVGDADGTAAPRLAGCRPPRRLLAELWAQCVEAMTAMAREGYAHGDLSAFNLLVQGERLVVIDVPQIVDLVMNPQGVWFLERDCRNVCTWFASRGSGASTPRRSWSGISWRRRWRGGETGSVGAVTHFDLVIIGSGTGNSLITPDFDDWRIALIEENTAWFGGTCLNVGCIPTKMFVYPADVADKARASGRLGLHPAELRADWPAIRDRVFGRIDPISESGRDYRRTGSPNVTLYETHAEFVGPRELLLGTGETITADRVVVAAGSRPVVPSPIADGDVPFHTSDSIMRIPHLPRRLAIVGAGFIAAEFAHVFTAFGTEVTMLSHSALLRSHDEDLSRRLTQLVRDDWGLRTGVEVSAIDGTTGDDPPRPVGRLGGRGRRRARRDGSAAQHRPARRGRRRHQAARRRPDRRRRLPAHHRRRGVGAGRRLRRVRAQARRQPGGAGRRPQPGPPGRPAQRAARRRPVGGLHPPAARVASA